MKYSEVRWKRNLAKISEQIKARLDELASDRVVVADTKKVPIADVEAGVYRHLGVSSRSGAIVVGEPVLPPANMGKWSTRNREGWEYPRKDLPKITKTFSWETPNFGDASTYGTHTHYQDREVYQVEAHEPRGYQISTEVLNEPTDAGFVLLKFTVETVLDRTEDGFDLELLWCLNLLQENCGVANVFASDATREDYIATVALDWEVFPPGTADEVIASVVGRKKGGDGGGGVMGDRIRLFSKLGPSAYLRGRGGFGSYIGAQFAEDLVVFENVNYGNALYVLYDDWKEVSQRSRIDLIKGTSEKFDRFIHTEDWEDRFLDHMRTELEQRGIRSGKTSRKRRR